jgi:hypothetical protein
LHNNVIFPDFSAFQMTIAGAAARFAPDHPEGNAEQGQAPSHAESPGSGTARVAVPPFSWLGADAWPNISTPPNPHR